MTQDHRNTPPGGVDPAEESGAAADTAEGASLSLRSGPPEFADAPLPISEPPESGRRLLTALVVLFLLSLVAGGYWTWRTYEEQKASRAARTAAEARQAEQAAARRRAVQATALTAPPAGACDRFAADPWDKARKAPGVFWKRMDIGAAIKACRSALGRYPEAPRFQAQYGRALYTAGRNAEAVPWLRKAAENGSATAQNLYGYMLQHGRGTRIDPAAAAAWFRRAAAQRYAEAEYNLGWILFYGTGIARNPPAAVTWLRRAARQGHRNAQVFMGYLYQNALVVPGDDRAAVAWYRKAALRGSAAGQNLLGWMYENGRGVPRDFDAARRWYRQAADQGFADAQSNLGVLYHDGRGVAVDYRRAYYWYTLAIANGHKRAQGYRARIANRLDAAERARIEARVRAWAPR